MSNRVESLTQVEQLASSETEQLHPCPACEMQATGSQIDSDRAANPAATVDVDNCDSSEPPEIAPATAFADARACEKWLRTQGFSRRVARAMASAWKGTAGAESEAEPDDKDTIAELNRLAAMLRS